jgi:hypothetical protein
MTRPLHIVYCLTATAGSGYETMTRVSVATLRLTNPKVLVTVVCDLDTYNSLQGGESQLFSEADSVVAVRTPIGTPTFRSRFVKTQLGCLIEGPFLFLDTDIVVRKPLKALQELSCDIAAAPNHSRDTLSEQMWSEDQTNLDAMGWQVREPYVNTGVIWYGGSKGSIAFASEWHQKWLANGEVTGRFRDQPAFNCVLSSSSQLRFKSLRHSWNAQVKVTPSVAKGARIWHVYSSTGFDGNDWFGFCCRQLKHSQPMGLQLALVKRMVAADNPIMPKSSPLFMRERLIESMCMLGKKLRRKLQD